MRMFKNVFPFQTLHKTVIIQTYFAILQTAVDIKYDLLQLQRLGAMAQVCTIKNLIKMLHFTESFSLEMLGKV